MAINPSQLSAQAITSNYDVTIQFLGFRPNAGAYNANEDTPNKLVGYYDSVQNLVELYIVDHTGHRYLRIS
jgi:hypothetical protein